MAKFIAAIFLLMVFAAPQASAQVRLNTDRVRTDRLDTVRQTIQERAEKTEETRTQIRDQVREVATDRQVQIVDNIFTRFDTINDKWVLQWSQVLQRLTQILDKIETRASSLPPNSNTTRLREAISLAREEIRLAQAAVDAQAAKEYSIQVTDLESLGQRVRSAVVNFKNDIKEVHQQVRQARSAVVQALNLLSQLADENQ